ncbi:MAG: DUF86 domain-containing protein, partial [Mycoplasmataceae bacterium]|nr:DUF86 domain-containing protein [Mycoplasmataceae bacterium]
MPSRSLEDHLEDILKEISLLESLSTITLDVNIKNHASERAIEIISEAITITRKEFNIDWKDFKFIVDIRNDIVHEYFDNSFNLIEEVIKNKLPELKKTV